MSNVAPTVVFALALTLCTLPAAGTAQEDGRREGAGEVPLYETLGDHHRNVTTDDPLAQAYFDQGMRLMYAFDTRRALRSFREAQRHDPGCAMCRWGEAWALSPYLNGRMSEDAEAAAFRATRRAAELVEERGTEAERALVAAFGERFADEPEADRRAGLDSAYARAMRGVALAHPHDDDVLTLWGESMLLLRPRIEMRDLDDPSIRTIRRTFERVLERDPGHPGACHLYIHLMEMSPEPEAAEGCADVLADRIPGASHIQHMPSHIYMRIGRYGDAVRANLDAWHVDQKGPERGMIPIYPAHNLEMLVFAANFDGRSALAVEAARELAVLQPSSAVLLPKTLALFGRWEEILAADEPSEEEPFAAGGWRFARGLALLRSGDVEAAGRELERIRGLREGMGEGGRYRGAPHRDLLALAGLLLEGEIARERGRLDEAVRIFGEAVRTEDGFPYSEPEPWHIPARRFLGAALLEAGRAAESERVYREALEDHRAEGWSLFGLARSVRAQGREREARRIEARFERAWERSDVWLEASRM